MNKTITSKNITNARILRLLPGIDVKALRTALIAAPERINLADLYATVTSRGGSHSQALEICQFVAA